MQRLKSLEAQMRAAPDQQISLTDHDSRSMAASGRGSGVVGYNVQVAVDAGLDRRRIGRSAGRTPSGAPGQGTRCGKKGRRKWRVN
jgi:hypothetical protein